jgi:hypothetical protein
MRLAPFVLFLVVLPATTVQAALEGVAVGRGGIRVLHEFAGQNPMPEPENGSLAPRPDCRSGVEVMPGFMLHPQPEGDAVLSFPPVQLPETSPPERLFLVFHAGMSDGIRWDSGDPGPNGARFSIRVNDQPLFAEIATTPGWRFRAIDLTPMAGSRAVVEFRTHAIDGNLAYDWALFGRPELIRLTPLPEPEAPLDPGLRGLRLRRLYSDGPIDLVTPGRAGDVHARTEPGTVWFVQELTDVESDTPAFDPGLVQVEEYLVALYRYRLELEGLQVSSPIASVDTPLEMLARLRNSGRGTFPAGAAELRFDVPGTDRLRQRSVPTAEIPPGTVRLQGLPCRWSGPAGRVVPTAVTLREEVQRQEIALAPPAPDTRRLRPGRYRALVEPRPGADGWRRAHVMSGTALLYFLIPEPPLPSVHRAHAYMYAWNGQEWQCTGTLSPLARVRTTGADGMPVAVDLRVNGVDTAPRTGLRLELGSAGEPRARVILRFVADRPQPRIGIRAELSGTMDLLGFEGPRPWIGDRAFGIDKDFALFPGLEYLGPAEGSSSTRDLAPPLHDRSVPAGHKITVPLMAVQARDSLTALLWDMNQEWAPGQREPAARFVVPPPDSTAARAIECRLLAPGVGAWRPENAATARTPYRLTAPATVRLQWHLVLEHAQHTGTTGAAPHRSALLLRAVDHWIDVFGLPPRAPLPRDWGEQRALSRAPFMGALWNEDPPGWRGLVTGTPDTAPALALFPLLECAEGLENPAEAGELGRRARLVIDSVVAAANGARLWERGGSHTVFGELPYVRGYLPEALAAQKQRGAGWIAGRTPQGLLVWHAPPGEKGALGIDGAHTLGQASFPVFAALRAARLSGDAGLAAQALDALRQFDLYEIPRGAAMWECPQFQPGMLAAAQAVAAFCEAYRLTGDQDHLVRARHWARTCLPFIYLWERPGTDRHAMLYNVVSDFGSTFFTHSWIGLPVMWCGLVYAWALQDLAQIDDSFPWLDLAEGITASAMWQQYTEGNSRGCLPDSWDLVRHAPNPVDIQPDGIMLNAWRLRGVDPSIRSALVERTPESLTVLNAPADIQGLQGNPGAGQLRFVLTGSPWDTFHTSLAQVDEPARITGVGARLESSALLDRAETGWLYDRGLRLLVIKCTPEERGGTAEITVEW